ncbi:MAG: hypothetical protein LBI18_05705 [Planctomycetaceae bacterium]|jgi:hypothetical protein|nr:hypothetical protein [Planctomycetaceae bacterium]
MHPFLSTLLSSTTFFLFAILFTTNGYCVEEKAEEKIGKRPYEMVNINRIQDEHPMLFGFENLDGWIVETVESEATFEQSREQQLWDNYVGKLTYKFVPTKNPKSPVMTLKPPKPIPVTLPFDCINIWIYGNNWAWQSDASTPRVQLDVLLKTETGKTVKIHLDTVRWKEWFLIHRKLSEEQLKTLGNSPQFDGFEIRNGRNTEPRTIYFDNISFYKEELKPLEYEPRPLRNISLPEGQTTGTNTGTDKLPFPNREETILPSNLCTEFKNSLTTTNNGTSFQFEYQGSDGHLVWNYTPNTGTFADLNFTWTTPNDKPQTLQFQNGGIRFVKEPAKETIKLLNVSNENNIVTSRWQFGNDSDQQEVEYRFQIVQKSLIVDVRSLGGNVSEVFFGEILGTKNPQLITVPYLTGNGGKGERPAILVDKNNPKKPLFFLPMIDHTRSNASALFFGNKIDQNKTDKNKIEDDIAIFDSGSRYKPKTDGKRNDCFERLFLTVSPLFEEVLPNIPNNPSPWKHVTAERVWRAHGSSNHENDFKYWNKIRRYGVEKMLITDHETMWRDGGESFTFRTYAAPGRGGDEAHKEYTQKIHGLGYIYGPYNNYTDYAPVNEFWNEDWVTRLPDGNFQPAWARCYNPKPTRAVQTEPKITEIVQKKFGFNTAYCDVHTAVNPWTYVDFDARNPGAGTFAATFYAYGEIMLHQKKIWNGPVYSEGRHHWYYSGLTDGNYAQDQTYKIFDDTWLADFDLLKIHPLENNFGMGNPQMFFGNTNLHEKKDQQTALDRFLAATLAFGHTGFLAMDYGFSGGLRSYFTVQQIAKRYGTQKVKSIRYANEHGNLLTTSEAVAADQVKLNRLVVEYEDGLKIYVNGNSEQNWQSPTILLSPNSWYVDDPAKIVTAMSSDTNGKRIDYVDSPAYLFAEIRNNPKGLPHRFERLLCDQQLIVLKNVDEKGCWEMIVGEPNYTTRSTLHAVRLDNDADADVVALDFERKVIGKAETRYSRGFVHVMPVDGAFSYRLTPKPKPENIPDHPETKILKGAPGEKIGTITIPPNLPVNTLQWINGYDFEIIPICSIKEFFDTENCCVNFEITSHLNAENSFRFELQQGEKTETTQDISFAVSELRMLSFKIDMPKEPKTIPLKLVAIAGNMKFEQKYQLKSVLDFRQQPELFEHFETGYCLRGKEPTTMDSQSGAYAYPNSQCDCGTKTQRGWAIHPPFRGGVGYTFLLSEPITVPKEEGITFSSEVGIRNGGDQSDGVLYRVFVAEPDKEEVLAGEILWAERNWSPFLCDLSAWQGKTIRLRLVADVGTKNNSVADWAAWANLKLVSTKPSLIITLNAE